LLSPSRVTTHWQFHQQGRRRRSGVLHKRVQNGWNWRRSLWSWLLGLDLDKLRSADRRRNPDVSAQTEKVRDKAEEVKIEEREEQRKEKKEKKMTDTAKLSSHQCEKLSVALAGAWRTSTKERDNYHRG